jgi:hypothetical protein
MMALTSCIRIQLVSFVTSTRYMLVLHMPECRLPDVPWIIIVLPFVVHPLKFAWVVSARSPRQFIVMFSVRAFPSSAASHSFNEAYALLALVPVGSLTSVVPFPPAAFAAAAVPVCTYLVGIKNYPCL